ncbi:hypothetical protein CF326_g2124 [Tilletia indica]|nr:hypothetical protein CF326_g2124 [Tilletia indica]
MLSHLNFLALSFYFLALMATVGAIQVTPKTLPRRGGNVVILAPLSRAPGSVISLAFPEHRRALTKRMDGITWAEVLGSTFLGGVGGFFGGSWFGYKHPFHDTPHQRRTQ